MVCMVLEDLLITLLLSGVLVSMTWDIGRDIIKLVRA